MDQMTDDTQYNLRRRDQSSASLPFELGPMPENGYLHTDIQSVSRILMGGTSKRRKLSPAKSNVVTCELCGETLASSATFTPASWERNPLCESCSKSFNNTSSVGSGPSSSSHSDLLFLHKSFTGLSALPSCVAGENRTEPLKPLCYLNAFWTCCFVLHKMMGRAKAAECG
jgi:hypothetical protein